MFPVRENKTSHRLKKKKCSRILLAYQIISVGNQKKGFLRHEVSSHLFSM